MTDQDYLKQAVKIGNQKPSPYNFGSFEIRVGYATCGLRREKSSLPAIRKMTVRMVSSRV